MNTMQTDSSGPRLYRALKALDAGYRRVHRHPVFHIVIDSGKRSGFLVALAIPILVALVIVYSRTQTQYYLLTGPHGSTETEIGPQIANALNEPVQLERWLHLNVIPDFSPVESCGSLDNIALLNQGRAQLALVEDGLPMHIHAPPECLLHPRQEGTQLSKETNEIRLRAVMPLYLAPVHVLSNRRLNFKDVRDIKPHSKIYIGPDGGATAFVSQLVLDHEGIIFDRKGKAWDFKRAMKELLDGKIDLAFFMIALNSDAIKQLLDSPDLHLLNIESAEGLKLLAPYLEVVKIPASTYKVSSREITTVAGKSILVASTDLTAAEVYEIRQKLSHHIHDILKGVPLNVTKVTESYPDLYYPLHAGAVRFYAHDPPFFLDPHFLAGIGTYASLVYAGFTFTRQLRRYYRVQRLFRFARRILTVHSAFSKASSTAPSERYLKHIRLRMAQMLHDGRLKMEDVGILNEFIKNYL
jgi:TRAP transporter TAXI family solute receptor